MLSGHAGGKLKSCGGATLARVPQGSPWLEMQPCATTSTGGFPNRSPRLALHSSPEAQAAATRHRAPLLTAGTSKNLPRKPPGAAPDTKRGRAAAEEDRSPENAEPRGRER